MNSASNSSFSEPFYLIDGLERSAIFIDEEGKKTDYIVGNISPRQVKHTKCKHPNSATWKIRGQIPVTGTLISPPLPIFLF